MGIFVAKSARDARWIGRNRVAKYNHHHDQQGRFAEGHDPQAKKKKTIDDMERIGMYGSPQSKGELADELIKHDVTADEFAHGMVGGLPVNHVGVSFTNLFKGPEAFIHADFVDGGETTGRLQRTLNFKNGTVDHDLLFVKETGKGAGKSILKGEVGLYQKLGMKEVTTFANVSVGGYAWAKYGFVPETHGEYSWRDLKTKLYPKIDELPSEDQAAVRKLVKSEDPKALWAVADSKYGKQLLVGTSWNGKLNLQDTETMSRFKSYVG